MPDRTYKWKRFWCERASSVALSDAGYLCDPGTPWGRIVNPGVLPIESIVHTPCLVLLGEPGMGKTHALEAERVTIDARAEQEGDQTLWLDLRSFGSEDRLVRSLFESREFAAWSNGGHRLHLFLDSLDECLMRVTTVGSLLIDQLGRCPVERLYLRIACRTADWHSSFEKGLRNLWGQDGIGVYELAPLSRKNIAEAAEANGLSSTDFLAELDLREAVPLAMKPVTLVFLLNTYLRLGRFPTTRVGLYREGCMRLCEEINASRRGARETGRLTAEQRLEVAAQIAAVTILANKYAVWMDIDWGDVPDEDVTVGELVRAGDGLDGRDTLLTEPAVRETLGTGLFSSRGSDRLGWAHQTYAEFLAAWYLARSSLSPCEIMSLLVHPGDAETKLVPQLYETSAWLASMVPDVFRAIVQSEPAVVLRSDTVTAGAKDREALVAALLSLPEEQQMLYRSPATAQQYRKLLHPRLAEQIRPYIVGTDKLAPARATAIEIASRCELRSLAHDLASTALDPNQPQAIRQKAASAVRSIGMDEASVMLRPLAAGAVGEDPDDELRGCALRALWPSHITAEEVFQSLTPPRRENLMGSYAMFLSYDLVRDLHPSDLPFALEWVQNQSPAYEASFYISRLMDAIMKRAWEELATPGVPKAFAHAVLSRVKQHDEIVRHDTDPTFNRSIAEDPTKRHLLLNSLVSLAVELQEDPKGLLYTRTPLLTSQDVLWMLERLQSSESTQEQVVWAQLISRVFDRSANDQLDAIFDACQLHPVLAAEFAWLLQPVELGSPQAERMKKSHARMVRWEQREEPRPLPDPPPEERIVTLLAECENADVAAWWRLNLEMTLEPDSTHYGDELEPDLTVLPGWKNVDTPTRARIIDGAWRYVHDQDPNVDEWLGTRKIHRPALAGYRALRLLMQEAPDAFAAISEDVWKKWAPILLAYPTRSNLDDEDPNKILVVAACKFAPTEVAQTLRAILGREDSEIDDISVMEKLKGCWDDLLVSIVLSKAQDPGLKPERMGFLLGELLEDGVREARDLAESMLSLPISVDEREQARAIRAAYVLMMHTRDADWSAVWPAIWSDVKLGQEVILKVAHGPESHAASIGQGLSEQQLADLYIWLVHQFPHSEDPKHEGFHSISPRESVAEWRNSLLYHLQRRGTVEACAALQRIAGAFPELPWLKLKLLEAQQITRQNTWPPPRPKDVLRLTRQPRLRLVRSGSELLTTVNESLRRLEAKLQGETPLAPFLWNEIQTGVFRPKEEALFSNFVKSHLEDDLGKRGVVVNREVEIHMGERTDIHVDAVVRDAGGDVYDSVAVIIEVKGCWNRELNYAMKNQLVERYLADNRCQHGLYLVAWFDHQKWDDGDYRKQQAPETSIEQAWEQFRTQAAELSHGGTVVVPYLMRIN